MPPKPFNPPRPTSSTTPATGSKPGRPKGSTNKTTSKPTSASITKRKSASSTTTKSKGKENANRKSKGMSGEKERLSAVSARSLLPSLSPDTGDEMEDVEEELQSQSQSQSQIDSSDPFSSQPHRTTKRKSHPDLEPEDHSEEETLHSRKEKIPDNLLAVLLQQFYKREGTRLSKSASKAVGKYMDTFVREGLARAAWAMDGDGRGGNGGMGGGGILEVEDLERLGPQLLMDF